jgi:hypothetical protein
VGPNCLAYSSNGIHWLPAFLQNADGLTGNEIFSGGQCNAVAWSGVVWVAGGSVGNNGMIAYSLDGLVWTQSTTTVFNARGAIPGSCLSLGTSGSLIIAGGQGLNQVAYSYDGRTWNAINVGFTGPNASNPGACYTVASRGPLQWMIGGQTGPVGFAPIRTSIVGTTSYVGTTGNTAANSTSVFRRCNAITWNGSQWLAGGEGTHAIMNNTSTAIANILWQPPTVGPSGICYALAWNATRWVAGGSFAQNAIHTSIDGFTWSQATNNTVLTVCTALAARNVLPYVPTIVGQPYFIGQPSNWISSGVGTNAPFSIPSALDLLAAYIRNFTNANPAAKVFWPN